MIPFKEPSRRPDIFFVLLAIITGVFAGIATVGWLFGQLGIPCFVLFLTLFPLGLFLFLIIFINPEFTHRRLVKITIKAILSLIILVFLTSFLAGTFYTFTPGEISSISSLGKGSLGYLLFQGRIYKIRGSVDRNNTEIIFGENVTYKISLVNPKDYISIPQKSSKRGWFYLEFSNNSEALAKRILEDINSSSVLTFKAKLGMDPWLNYKNIIPMIKKIYPETVGIEGVKMSEEKIKLGGKEIGEINKESQLMNICEVETGLDVFQCGGREITIKPKEIKVEPRFGFKNQYSWLNDLPLLSKLDHILNNGGLVEDMNIDLVLEDDVQDKIENTLLILRLEGSEEDQNLYSRETKRKILSLMTEQESYRIEGGNYNIVLEGKIIIVYHSPALEPKVYIESTPEKARLVKVD